LRKLSKNYKLALISCGGDERKKVIEKLGITEFFASIQIVLDKEEKQFKQVIRDLHCRPEEILVVGDRLEDEIKIARELGMVGVWLRKKRFFVACQNQEQKPCFIIDSLYDLNLFID